MPVPENDVMLPPVAVISSKTKSVDASDSVIVNVAVSPTFNSVTSEAMLIVGSTVSTARVTMLEAVLFALPAASVNFGEETLITPSALLSSSGVNIAV